MEASPVNSDYLTELIPYRCPKCGDLRRFATLRELKRHLEGDHSFKMGCIKPRKRMRVFNQDAKDKSKLMDKRSMSPSSGERDSEDSARLSPLLHSYKEEAKMLEMQVEFAKQEELRNKLSGIESKVKDIKSSSSSGSVMDSNSAASVSNEKYSKPDPSIDRIGDVNSTTFVNHGQNVTNVPSSLSKYDCYSIPPLRSGYSEFRNVLSSLNQELIRSRQRQWESAESLHKAEDVLLGMEKAAEERCEEQRKIIQNLMKGLKDKEDILRSAGKELDALQSQRQRLVKETEDLFYKADERNGILRHELEQKETQISCFNRELERLKFYSETELRQKDEELKKASKTVKRLEWERENLIREAEELLKRADIDREGLRKAHERKEEQLRHVNKDLDKLRWEQQDLLEQSIELYKKADEGTSILKGMLKAKDQQLNNALEELKHMQEVQTRLLEESRWLTQQADENSDVMKKLLVKKEEQFREVQHELEKLRDEEKSLRETTCSFASKAESNSAIIENLQGLVRRKEEELSKTKMELSSLKTFISQTAEKERVARAKLEKFIGELIDRADKAEKELRILTRTSNLSSSGSQGYLTTNAAEALNEHAKQSRSPGNETQSIWTRKLAENFATKMHIYESRSTQNMRDSSATQQRDSKQPPQKPDRKGKINPLGHQIVDLGVDSWFENYPEFSLHPAMNAVPDHQLKVPSSRSIKHKVADKHNSDKTVVDSARPEESFGVSKHVHDRVNNTETVNLHLQNVQMNGNISYPQSVVQSRDDPQDNNNNFQIGTQFVSHKHVHSSQINANNNNTQSGPQFPEDRHEDNSQTEVVMQHYTNKNVQHNRLLDPLQYKASSESQQYITRQEKEIMFRQGGELATRGNQRIVQPDFLEHSYATRPKIETMPRHGGEVLQTKNKFLQPDIDSSDRLVNQISVMTKEQTHYPDEADQSEPNDQEVPLPEQIISNRRHDIYGREHSEFQPDVSEPRSKAMLEPAGFDSPPKQIPRMLQEHQKRGRHHPRAVRNETYGQEAPRGKHINNNGRHFFYGPEQYNSDILTPPMYLQDYSSMPFGLNDPRYFRNEVDHDDINYQNEPGYEEAGKYQPSSYVTKQHYVPYGRRERMHQVSKSEADLPRQHLNTPPGHTNVDHSYLNKRLRLRKATRQNRYHLSQPVKANLRRQHLRIHPGPLRIDPGGHLSRKAATSLKDYMLPKRNDVDDYILPDRPSSSYRRRTKSQSPTAGRRVRPRVNPDHNYEDDDVEDSYTFSGGIIPPRNLKKLSVATMPIVRPTRRRQAEINRLGYGLSTCMHDPRGSRHDQSYDSDNNEEEKQVDTFGDVNNGNFEQIIDENGIMWEDNQDTLPDISDSELDRISPSGTEAVIGNTTNYPIFPNNREDVSVSSRQSQQNAEKGTRKAYRDPTFLSKKGNVTSSGAMERSTYSQYRDLDSGVNISRQTFENPPQKNQAISSANENISNSEFDRSNFDNVRKMSGKDTTGRSLSASDLYNGERYSKSSSGNSKSFVKSQSPLDSRSKYLSGEEESKRSKLFQPIKSPVAKSASDLDLTSGGREVHATFILRENNDTNFPTPDSMLFKKLNDANKEARPTDGNLFHNSEYNRESPISDMPEILTEESYSVRSDSENSLRHIDLAQKPTRLRPNTDAAVRESPSVKSFKDKLDAVAQKYGVKSRYAKTPEAKQEHSSSYQDKVNAIAQKYSLKSIISNPVEISGFRSQSCQDRADNSANSLSHIRLSSGGEISRPEKRFGSSKQRDKGEQPKYDLQLDNNSNFSRDRSSSSDRQHNSDRNPNEISQMSCDKSLRESSEISVSSQGDSFSGVERHPCDETHVDQDGKFSNDRFSVSDRRLTPNKHSSPVRHGSLDGKMNTDVRDNSTFSDINSCKMVSDRKSSMLHSASDTMDEKLDEAEYTNDWEMDNVLSDASLHSKAHKSPSNANMDKTDTSSNKHGHGSRDKENKGQEGKVKEMESVHSRDVSYEFSDTSQKEEAVKQMDMRMPDSWKDPSSILNPDDSTKDTFVKHDVIKTLESERNELRSDHSTNTLELSDSDNIEDLHPNNRESINRNFNDARLTSLTEGRPIKQSSNTIITMADVHKEDLDDDCQEYLPEMDDLTESATALSDLQQPGSMFAEPIIESSSMDGDSNTQSFMDQNNVTETELDTDIDSHRISQDFSSGADKDGFKIRVKKKVYSKSRGKRQTAKRLVLSPASSQASLDQLDRLPRSRREDTKKRREVLYHIFSFLDTATLSQVAAVCKEWKIVSRNPRLWQRVQLKNDKISSQFLMTISKWCTKLKFLTLEDLKPRNRRWGETLGEYNVNIRACLEPGLEQLLKKCESTLISLRIVNCGNLLTSKVLWAASGYSRLLQHVTYLSDIDPVGPEVMWALGAGCRDIRTLVIPPLFPCQNVGRFNTKCVQLIGKFFHDLEVLNIGGQEVDLTSLVNVAQSCQRLHSIELTHMAEMTQTIATSVCNQGLSKLQTLIFTCTPVALDALKSFFKSCAHLKQITIQLGPKDYFAATKKESEKEYEAYVDQLQKLKSKPGLGTILQLKIQPVVKVVGDEKEEGGIISWFTEKFK